MAKKAGKKTEPDREERTGYMTKEVLAAIATELRNLAAKMDGLAYQLKKDGLESVKIDGFSKPNRAYRLILEYENHAHYRIKEEAIRRRQ